MAKWNNFAKFVPRFSVGTLFIVTTCCAVGMAVWTGTSVGRRAGWGGELTNLRVVFDILLSVASVLLISELWGQCIKIRRLANGETLVGSNNARTQIRARLFFAIALVVFLFLSILKQHQVIPRTSHPEPFLFLSTSLFPQVVWLLTLILTLLIASDSLPSYETSRTRKAIEGVVIWGGGIFLLWHLATDEYYISFLVHLATEGIEASHALDAKRSGTFPTHAREGFFTFFSTVGGLIALLVASKGLITFYSTSSRPMNWVAAIAYLLGIGISGLFCWWFYTQELFRISPDLAPHIGQAAVVYDWIGIGLITLVGTVFAANRLIEITPQQDGSPRPTIRATRRLLLANLAMLSASVIVVYDVVRSAITPIAGFFGNVTVGAEMIRYVFTNPESILLVAMLFATLGIAWRWLRRGAPEIVIQPIEPRRLFWAWLGLVALVIVGVPVVAAFGFCWWLGPWYL